MYKFKNWDKHKNGNNVTVEEKEERAKYIAKELSNNKKWKSHGKGITIAELVDLKLKIEDYSHNVELRPLICDYYNVMDEYIRMKQIRLFIHNRVLL